MKPIHILILTHTDEGGAGTAILGFAKGLTESGYKVQMIVGRKRTDADMVTEVPVKQTGVINRVLRLLKRKFAARPIETAEKYFFFNTDERHSAFSDNDIVPLVTEKPDIVIGAWLSYFLNYDMLGRIAKQFNARPYLLMNDMAMLTGGCHYAWDCEGYTHDCSACPAIVKSIQKQRAKENLQQRQQAVKEYGIEIIAGSRGTLEQCRVSTLFRNQEFIKVYNGILDFTVFNSQGRKEARQEMGFSVSERVLLCGTNNFDDPRKGKDKFLKALQQFDICLAENGSPWPVTLALVGDIGDTVYDFKHITVKKLPVVKEKGRLALMYKAADMFVSPSVEDSGPLMVVEALACGTPVIGFDIGFVHDFVQDGVNGYRIEPYDVSEMGRKMALLLMKDEADWISASVDSVKMVFAKENLVSFFK